MAVVFDILRLNMGRARNLLANFLAYVLLFVILLPLTASAANSPTAPFSLEVTPSPIVETVKPAERKTIELRIRNAGNGIEKLRMELRDFETSSQGEVSLNDSAPRDLEKWVTFSNPQFEIKSGEWFTQTVILDVPNEAAFSYGFAILISRVEKATPAPGQANLQGSVAVFTLINVDRLGAKRSFSVESFQTSRRLYEYLPASFSYTIKNTGNAIVRPEGNIFIQRTSSSQPISVLKLNEANSYIIPETSRTFRNQWSSGFPVFQEKKSADNAQAQMVLHWDLSQAQEFRFGHYVAKMVAIYNDGQRDVPIEAEVGFWVIPWKIMALGLVVVAILVIGLVAIIKKAVKIGRHAHRNHSSE